jgi:flagellar hook-length control protein FliK
VSRGATAEELELAEKVMSQLRARLQLGQREALIELRPSELGRIGVHLRFEDGALTATIRAERPETLAVLEAHAPELRAWLAQGGTEVREIDLGLAEDGAYFDKPEQRPHDRAEGRRGESSNARTTRERAPEAVQGPQHTNTGDTTLGVDVLV